MNIAANLVQRTRGNQPTVRYQKEVAESSLLWKTTDRIAFHRNSPALL